MNKIVDVVNDRIVPVIIIDLVLFERYSTFDSRIRKNLRVVLTLVFAQIEIHTLSKVHYLVGLHEAASE